MVKSKKKLSGTYVESLEHLIICGTMLSNIAFNLSQSRGHELDLRDCESMKKGFKNWDSALLDFRKRRP